MRCPTCDSETIRTAKEIQTFPLAFGEEVTVPLVVNTCGTCQEQGDFEQVNDVTIEAALHKAEAQLAARIIDDLSKEGLSMAHCECSLGLAPRTMARWKNGSLSEAALVVLKMVKTYPFLLDVARQRYEPAVAEVAVTRHFCAATASYALVTAMSGVEFYSAEAANSNVLAYTETSSGSFHAIKVLRTGEARPSASSAMSLPWC